MSEAQEPLVECCERRADAPEEVSGVRSGGGERHAGDMRQEPYGVSQPPRLDGGDSLPLHGRDHTWKSDRSSWGLESGKRAVLQLEMGSWFVRAGDLQHVAPIRRD